MAHKKSGIVGAVAAILIGAAIVAFVVNILFDTLVASGSANATATIVLIRPIVNTAIVLIAVLAIVVVAAQMMGALGGI